jgi:hypothetical protein
MYSSCKYIGICKWVKIVKRTQVDQGKYFTYWAKKRRFYFLSIKVILVE